MWSLLLVWLLRERAWYEHQCHLCYTCTASCNQNVSSVKLAPLSQCVQGVDACLHAGRQRLSLHELQLANPEVAAGRVVLQAFTLLLQKMQFVHNTCSVHARVAGVLPEVLHWKVTDTRQA